MMTNWSPIPLSFLLDGRVLGLSPEHRLELLRMYFTARGSDYVPLHREDIPACEATWNSMYGETLAPALKELLRSELIAFAPGGVRLRLQVSPLPFQEVDVRARGAGSFVYAIGPVGYDTVKIGYSKNPWKRLQDLQHARAETLAIYALMPGGEREEGALHRRFAKDRIRPNGEWFHASEDVIVWCKQWGVRW